MENNAQNNGKTSGILLVLLFWLVGTRLPIAIAVAVMFGILYILAERSNPDHKFFQYAKKYFFVILMFGAAFGMMNVINCFTGLSTRSFAAYCLKTVTGHGITPMNYEVVGYVLTAVVVASFVDAYYIVFGVGKARSIARWTSAVVAGMSAIWALATITVPNVTGPIVEARSHLIAGSATSIAAASTKEVALVNGITFVFQKGMDGKIYPQDGEVIPGGSKIMVLNETVYENNVQLREVRLSGKHGYYDGKSVLVYASDLATAKEVGKDGKEKDEDDDADKKPSWWRRTMAGLKSWWSDNDRRVTVDFVAKADQKEEDGYIDTGLSVSQGDLVKYTGVTDPFFTGNLQITKNATQKISSGGVIRVKGDHGKVTIEIIK